MTAAPDDATAPPRQDFLRARIDPESVAMAEIAWPAPAELLDKLTAYEAVHAITGPDALRRRLEPSDR